MLRVAEEDETPPSQYLAPAIASNPQRVVQWNLADLRASLSEKHASTCFVAARTRGRGAEEEFWYTKASCTQSPLVGHLSALLEVGVVELDFLVHLLGEDTARPRARDHGYLFKIRDGDFDLLFGKPRVYELS